MIEALVPAAGPLSVNALAELLPSLRPGRPFDDAIVAYAADLSRRLMHDPEAARHAELVALAYFMRPTELRALADGLAELAGPATLRAARGLVFHVPPSNVDTVFLYSWLLAALCGNASVVRVSARAGAATGILLRLLAAAPPPRSLFVRAGHDDEVTAMLSAACDTRVIWGGDATVARLRAFPLGPSATELAFPDRFSLALLRAGTGDVAALARAFAADAFFFNQLGCSSPRLVVWAGPPDERFWPALAAEAERRGVVTAPATLMAKRVAACRAAIDHDVERIVEHGPAVTVVRLRGLSDVRHVEHPGGGLFFEAVVDDAAALAPFLTRRDQTLATHGFAREELVPLAVVDRIVPIGQALAFGRYWDGHDLLAAFTRAVHLR